jgi:hypothetical protein
MTESNRSSSSSRRALTAFAKSLGKICRGEVLVIAGDDEGAFADANGVARLEVNENRSGVDDRPPMFNHTAVEIGPSSFDPSRRRFTPENEVNAAPHAGFLTGRSLRR